MHFLSKCPYCFLYLSESCPTAVNLYPLSWISFLSGKLFVSLSLSLTFALTSSGSFGFASLHPAEIRSLEFPSSRASCSFRYRCHSLLPSLLRVRSAFASLHPAEIRSLGFSFLLRQSVLFRKNLSVFTSFHLPFAFSNSLASLDSVLRKIR